MERTIPANLAATKSKVTGWEKRQTSRPTSLMVTTKFNGGLILVSSLGRRHARRRSILMACVQLQRPCWAAQCKKFRSASPARC